MFLQKIKVRGRLGLELEFKKTTIILGENNTGKSTLMNLILYSLGSKIEDFIDEIKNGFCNQVELDIRCKNGHSYRIIRALPYSDMITVIPILNKEELQQDATVLLNLQEFSDFILQEEGYSIQTISYGKNKSASLRLYFLLRAVFVDQNTNASAVLANIGGEGNHYINNQKLIKKAIIEELLGKENFEIQQLRFRLQEFAKEKQEVNAQSKVVKEIINSELREHEDLVENRVKILDKIQEIEKEKENLSKTNLENMYMVSNINEKQFEDEVIGLEKEKELLTDTIRNLKLEIMDVDGVIQQLSEEMDALKKAIIARQILTQIPVDTCPICLSYIEYEHTGENCPHCRKQIELRNEDSALRYKRVLEESLQESIYLKNEMEQQLAHELQRKQILDDEIRRANDMILEKREIKHPFEQIIDSIKERYEYLIQKEQLYKNFLKNLSYKDGLNGRIELLNSVINKYKTELTELESLSNINDSQKIETWQQEFNQTLRYIFGDVKDVELDGNLMPNIDGNDMSKVSSASLKVAARLAYVLSLLKLNDTRDIGVNHLGFALFDSPKDKDLDPNKYRRFLRCVQKIEKGQIILTGSIEEKYLYEGIFEEDEMVLELYSDEKLLDETVN